MNATADQAALAPPVRGRLENLPNAPRLTREEADARSRLVRRLRIGLPVLGLVMLGVFFVLSSGKAPNDVLLNDFASLDASPEDLRMANPRFAGLNDAGEPYEITADAAIQQPDGAKLVELENPKAVSRKTDETTVVVAERGLFRSEENILELNDAVTMERNVGGDLYVLKTPAATVSIDEETVVSTSGVEGAGPGGATLRADRMTAYNNEGRVHFEGNVSMRIFPNSVPAPPLRAGAETPDQPEAPEEANEKEEG